ncbi:MAG: universal stress protein [Actinobacteria bacterium]|nr:universal stress protein [Actinomycetota bacterium]
MDFKRIVVGVDASDAAAAAVRWAAKAAGTAGEVVAVHSTRAALIGQAAASAATGLGMFPDAENPTEEAAQAVERWCDGLRDAGVAYRTVVSDSEPVQALLDTARHEDADLIVIGHQGDTGLLHRLFQGLSDHLIDHAQRPVLVVPYHQT